MMAGDETPVDSCVPFWYQMGFAYQR